MKKYFKIIFITFLFTLHFQASATEINGRIQILNNDGSTYKVLLQINTDTQLSALGGTTIVVDFDNSKLNFPEVPVTEIDYLFSNFNLGSYDSATVTKVADNHLWINIDLLNTSHGTIVANGPDLWTDLVQINFSANSVISTDVIFWNPGSSFWQVYDEDNITSWEPGNFDNISSVTNVNDPEIKNIDYTLSQNYPNPFNPATTIRYAIPQDGFVSLKVYDVLGNEIENLVSENKIAGTYEVQFNAENLPSGFYVYRLMAGSFTETRKMILLK